MKYKEYRANSNRNTVRICHSCRYSIEVRQEIFGNNLRTFVWQGGMGLDVNGDRSIADIPDDPATPKDETLIETTVPWCFEYGEEEWLEGKKFSKVRENAEGDALALPPIPPVGRISCESGDSI